MNFLENLNPKLKHLIHTRHAIDDDDVSSVALAVSVVNPSLHSGVPATESKDLGKPQEFFFLMAVPLWP